MFQRCKEKASLYVHLKVCFPGQVPIISQVMVVPEFCRFFDALEVFRDWVAFFLTSCHSPTCRYSPRNVCYTTLGRFVRARTVNRRHRRSHRPQISRELPAVMHCVEQELPSKMIAGPACDLILSVYEPELFFPHRVIERVEALS